jgi:hypothetical protein
MTKFELTLNGIHGELENRLMAPYTKIWVQGCTKPNFTKILFTVFEKNGYKMRFFEIKNFKYTEDKLEINNYVNSFKETLKEFIRYE